MVTINEINGGVQLKAWLEALPRETEAEKAEARRIAVMIAFRAAARVLPFWWEFCLTDERARQHDLTALPILRSLLLSSVTVKLPTYVVRSATTDAANAAANAATANAANAANAAANAAAAVYATDAADAYAYSDAAANAASAAADAYANDAAYRAWGGVRGDLLALMAGEDVFAGPLWPKGAPLEGEWRGVRGALEAAGQSEAWGFWLWWYQGLVDGTAPAPDSPLIVRIALLPDEVWKDEAAALERINEIWEKDRQALAEKANSPIDRDGEIIARGGAVPSRVKALLADNEALNAEKRQLVENLEHARIAASSTRESYKQLKREVLAAQNEIADWKADIKHEFEKRVANAEAAMREQFMIAEPVSLWKEKQEEHEARSKDAQFWFLVGLGVVGAFLVGVLVFAVWKPDVVVSLLAPPGCDPVQNVEACKGLSPKGLLMSGAVLSLFTLLLWFARLKMKEYLSERHLALDARERRAFAQSFVGFVLEGEGVGVPQAMQQQADQRAAIVYAALFRPSTDGIVKDDGGLDPSISAALSKLLSK